MVLETSLESLNVHGTEEEEEEEEEDEGRIHVGVFSIALYP